MRRFHVVAIPAAVQVLTAMIIIAGCAATAFARSQGGQVKGDVLAVGTAPLRDGNLAAARKQALADALRKGVEEYLLRRLGGEAVAGGLSRFIQDLVPAARDEIANYNMIAEEELGGEAYLVLVRVRVNEQTLESTLEQAGFLRQEGPPVKVLFMVSQHVSGSEQPAYWWNEPGNGDGLLPVELFLNRAFEELGFSLASRAMKVPEGENAEDLLDADLTLEEAAEWGRLCSAEVVIIGSCVQSGDIVSMHLQAVDAASASVLAEQGVQASLAPDLEGPERIRDGIERAVKSTALPLADRIREAFQPPESDPERFPLTLQGIGSFTLLQQFTRFLRDGVPGVESVTQTRFKGDTVTFSIGYREGVDRFLDSMLNRPELPFPLTARKDESGEIIVTPL
jgi:hypothetical protein